MKKLLGCMLLIHAGTIYAAQSITPIVIDTTHHWEGPYIGLTTGVTWGSAHTLTTTNQDGFATGADTAAINQAGDQTIRPQGFTAGIEAGYNWLFRQYFVGMEADIESLKLGDSNRSNAIPYPSHPADTFVIGSYVNENWLATLRPRIGIVYKETLLYLTGGLGITRLNGNFYFTDSNGQLTSGSINTTKAGITIGGGAELALTKQWSVKLEYLYTYFNRTNANATGSTLAPAFPSQVFTYSTNLNTNLLRVGFNYNLG